MESKWYKYKNRILNLSIFDEFKVVTTAISSHEIICCVNGQTKDWFEYSSLKEAERELEKIYNILSK